MSNDYSTQDPLKLLAKDAFDQKRYCRNLFPPKNSTKTWTSCLSYAPETVIRTEEELEDLKSRTRRYGKDGRAVCKKCLNNRKSGEATHRKVLQASLQQKPPALLLHEFVWICCFPLQVDCSIYRGRGRRTTQGRETGEALKGNTAKAPA